MSLRLLANPDDEILVPKPSYPLFDFLADLQDVKLVPYLLLYDHGWQIDFSSLAKALSSRTRAVVLVHPNNPTGSFVSVSEREQMNQFCRERNLALIVDEAHLLIPEQLEQLRLLTSAEMDSATPCAVLLVGGACTWGAAPPESPRWGCW